jgi:hypothetical protein
MRPPTISVRKPDFNMLRVGSHYSADTNSTTVCGEYLGVETPYGERSILLRHTDGRTSTIPLRRVVSLTAVAAPAA